MLAEGYERFTITHVRGTHTTLERALNRFPVRKPFDLADSAYWSWAWLVGKLSIEAPTTLLQGRATGWQSS